MRTYQYAHRRVAVCAVPSSRSVQVRRSMYEASSDRSMRYQSLVVPSYVSQIESVVASGHACTFLVPRSTCVPLLPRIACALVPQHFVFLSTSSSCARACFRATCPPAVKCASPQWVQQRLRWYPYVAPSSIQWAAGQHGTMFSPFPDMFACICGPLPASFQHALSCDIPVVGCCFNRPPTDPNPQQAQ